MKKLFIVSAFCLLSSVWNSALFAQDSKPLYQLPSKKTVAASNLENGNDKFLVGSDSGLYRVTYNNTAIPLWKEGRVDQLIEVGESSNTEKGWIMRTSKGIFYTSDLEHFEERDDGLPFLTIKKYENNIKSLEKQIQELKDLCVNPVNNAEMVTATKDKVFYTKDSGKSWISLGSMSKTTAGIKAVAVATIEGQTVVFMSHPIFGLSYNLPNKNKDEWNDVTEGFEKMPSLTSPDEISDIIPVLRTRADGSCFTEIYISQMYIPRVYKFNWTEKKGELIFAGKEPADTIDGLTTIDNVLLYTRLEGFGAIDLESLQSPGTPAQFNDWLKAFSCVPGMINTAWIPESRSGFSSGLLLNELWMLYPGTVNSPYAAVADGKKSIYASAYQCSFAEGVAKFKNAIKARKMNSIVIDMKDDYGFLRYNTKNPLVMQKCSTSSYAIRDLDAFINEFKSEGIYLIARIVTFKDKSLAKYDGGKYAVWDSKNNKPWLGIKGSEEAFDDQGNSLGKQTAYYDENWVDPYSEEVWEYNVAIARELIERGFDEIQFDYIRFPTDGVNLYNARYRWQDKGMDKESALISFLSYARANIDAPIGIDIYGANGWYRSGARTGQDAEMLAEYVDVIGPMFYPSHFEQTFLNYAPVADRTYRIYYYGSFRNTVLCRNRAIIRPWVQSFYLNVSYDRLYYDSNYIKKQFFGVRDSLNRGYMCWNNSGDYSTTPPDILLTDSFIGTAAEANKEFKKPAIGTAKKLQYTDSDVSVLDSIVDQNKEPKMIFMPFLQTQALPAKKQEKN